MLILIAESKTMTACGNTVDTARYSAHTPLFAPDAEAAMAKLRGMNVAELAKAAKLSPSLAQKLCGMIYDFPNKSLGSEAIEAYTGVVFKAFDYRSLDKAERDRTCRRVRIVSSLYGWLHPDDIVKPYRFDFATAPTADGQAFTSFWRDKLTDCLLNELADGAHTEVLNLMPADASRGFDWKRISEYASVVRADFREMKSGGVLSTPNSNMLKNLRGTLLRQLIIHDINDTTRLRHFASNSFIADDSLHTPDTLVFITAKE